MNKYCCLNQELLLPSVFCTYYSNIIKITFRMREILPIGKKKIRQNVQVYTILFIIGYK